MNGLVLRIAGGLLGALALTAAAWLIRDRFHQKDLADSAATCAVAAAAIGDDKPLDACLPAVASEVRAARQGRICETALLPSLRPETRFAMAQACGAGVKRLVADRDSLEQERDGLAHELAAQQDTALRAIGRAEGRASRQQERDNHARQVIDAAPRDAGGGIRCDADCLRQLGL